jgi:hypothetical protein
MVIILILQHTPSDLHNTKCLLKVNKLVLSQGLSESIGWHLSPSKMFEYMGFVFDKVTDEVVTNSDVFCTAVVLLAIVSKTDVRTLEGLFRLGCLGCAIEAEVVQRSS